MDRHGFLRGMPQRNHRPRGGRAEFPSTYFSGRKAGADDEFIIFLDALPRQMLQGLTKKSKKCPLEDGKPRSLARVSSFRPTNRPGNPYGNHRLGRSPRWL